MHDRLGEDLNPTSCKSLIESMQRHGQKQPVLGRRVASEPGYEVELIYGARRLFAAQHLGMDLLVELRDIDDREALVEMDIENRIRTDISPYERGLSYQRWLRAGYFENQLEIARALRVSQAQVSRLLKYAELPAVVVQAFRSPRDIREEWAVVLAHLCRDPARREITVRRARRVADAKGSQSPQAIFHALTAEKGAVRLQRRARAEVVKGSKGSVLFKVSYRASSVHVILPRGKLTDASLASVTEAVKGALELYELGASSKAAPGSNRVLEPLRGELAANGGGGRIRSNGHARQEGKVIGTET